MKEKLPIDGYRRDRRGLKSWKVLIVDDDQGVHDVTTLAFKRFIFDGKPISFYHAYNGREACDILQQNPDTALIFLDVVMETDDAGLQTVRYIREKLDNRLVRIVIRTAQPGAAPEDSVVRDYDINDYKDKTDLTIQKLKTTMYAGLRSYQDLSSLARYQTGLQRVIESADKLKACQQKHEFLHALPQQLATVLDLPSGGRHDENLLLMGRKQQQNPQIISGTGRFADLPDGATYRHLPEQDLQIIEQVIKCQQSILDKNRAAVYLSNRSGQYGVIYLPSIEHIPSDSHNLMMLFSRYASMIFENISLQQQLA